jgi:hypothetical protein
MQFLRLPALLAAMVALAVLPVGGPPTALGNNDERDFRATLLGINETPSINSQGRASLRLQLNDSSIDFQLRYANLTFPPTVAHIHFGQRHVAGGVMVFFCGGGGKPSCPNSTSGTITGTIVAADVVGPAAQGIQAGDFAAVLRAIRSGASYGNMHNATFSAGEIRGQLFPRERGDRGDRGDDD